MQKHPSITMVRSRTGRLRSKVQDGLDVWEYVLVARNFAGDAQRTAQHLGEPLERVRAALAYHREHPAEVDERLAEMDEAGHRAARGPVHAR